MRWKSLLISTLLVIIVVSLFLQSWRATLIPASAVIVSLLGTLGVMYLSGFLLDNLSLMALTVATGFVVDDAIVVVENIARHVEDGMKPFEPRCAAREVGFTVLSISLSLVAVFVPLIFMGAGGATVPRICADHDGGGGDQPDRLADRDADAGLPRAGRPEDGKGQCRFPRHAPFLRLAAGPLCAGLDWALHHRGPVLLSLLGAVILNFFLIASRPRASSPAGYRRPQRRPARRSISFTATWQADPDREDRAGIRIDTVVVQRRRPARRRFPLRDAEAARRPADHGIQPCAQAARVVQSASIRCRIWRGRASDQRHLSICAARRQSRPAQARRGQGLKAQPPPSPTSTSTSRTPAPAPLSPSTATAPRVWALR
jgi:hypothetical protein